MEIDTKNKVMEIRKKRICICVLLMAFFACGCQKNPDINAVINKSDGSFDIKVIQSATETIRDSNDNLNQFENGTLIATESTQHQFQYQSQFMSSDNSVNFTIDLNTDLTDLPMPVVEVAPHRITIEDAKQVAHVLFGNATFYEAEPLGMEVFSKSEIQAKIDRLLSYEGRLGYYDSAIFDSAKKQFIEEYTLKMETAPDENPHRLCPWEYRKSSYYYWTTEELSTIDTSQDNDELQVRVNVNGIPYLMIISTRDRSDYKINNIYVMIDDGPSPLSADMYIFQNRLCQTVEPDEENITAVSQKAFEMLQQMNLGDWVISECYVEVANQDDFPEYMIVVNAVPQYENVSAVRIPQITGLTSEEAYASNYYLTNAQFKFNAAGTLLSMEMISPIDMVSLINNNVLTLGLDELMSRAENHLKLSDYHAYDRLQLIPMGYEDYYCAVSINDADYGLARVKVPNTDDSYYYVPAIFFYGTIQFQGKETDSIYDVTIEEEVRRPILVLNAIDGSIIHTTNG